MAASKKVAAVIAKRDVSTEAALAFDAQVAGPCFGKPHSTTVELSGNDVAEVFCPRCGGEWRGARSRAPESRFWFEVVAAPAAISVTAQEE